MTTRSWYEYEWQRPNDPDGEWTRGSFAKRQDIGYPDPPNDEADALEMLQVISLRWKTGTRMRLVHVVERVPEGSELVARGYE